MSSNTNNKSAAPRKGGSPLMTGILVGMVIGVGLAAGLAWYLMKSPTPFLPKEPLADKPAIDSPRLNPPAGTTISGVNGGKPRFEFYKVLTDKEEKTIAAPAKPADKPRMAEHQPIAEHQPAVSYEPHLLQVGSFQNTDDAEKLKAKLALLGYEANIQSANIPDKGVWYRVRLGPYHSADEVNRVRGFLKQNGVDSTPIRSQ